MKHIKLFKLVGSFAENKDIARDVRIKIIIPALEKNQKVVLDFSNIDSATQSFIHALISDLFRKYNNEILDRIEFKSCNKTIQQIINIVADYMQESD